MKRLVAILAGVLLTVLARQAFAEAPIIEPLPGEDFVIPTGGACSLRSRSSSP